MSGFSTFQTRPNKVSKLRALTSARDQYTAKVRKRHDSARYCRNGGTPERVARRISTGAVSGGDVGAFIENDTTDARANIETTPRCVGATLLDNTPTSRQHPA